MTKLIVQPSNSNDMEISKQQYEYALNRIEELLPLVTDETPTSDKNSIELTIVSDVVEAYEKLHYPIAKPTIGELISLSIEEKGMTQKQLAKELGVSPSRVSDYISGRAEPTLRIARAICLILGIAPAAMLGM
ncbi:MAG: helix-turn-helix domain-containing protein [Muribaculaceae bacterium]|nr:helix-turn-helix domain-containing protein [Muribaculaceae bacterium]